MARPAGQRLEPSLTTHRLNTEDEGWAPRVRRGVVGMRSRASAVAWDALPRVRRGTSENRSNPFMLIPAFLCACSRSVDVRRRTRGSASLPRRTSGNACLYHGAQAGTHAARLSCKKPVPQQTCPYPWLNGRIVL